jgi:hypothetical protein
MLLGKAEERVSICESPADVSDLLGVAAGTPVMYLDCVLFLLDRKLRPLRRRTRRMR